MSIPLESLERFYERSEDSYLYLSASKDDYIIFHHTGVMNAGFANALTSRIELTVGETVENKQSQKRFFTVYVEVIQNILIHSEKDVDGDVHAGITIFLNGDRLCARFTNIVDNSSSQVLLGRYDEVNGLNRADLKAKYMDIMVNGDLSKKGGAGLGVITVVLRSKNPADVSVAPLDKNFDIFTSTFFIDT